MAETVGAPHARLPGVQDLFIAGVAGYHTYRIPAIAVAPGGAILAAAAGRLDSASDWANCDIMLRRSTDGGVSWERQRMLVDDGNNTVDNPTFIVDAAHGETHLMYQVNYAGAYLTTSGDEGASWSPAREITSAFEEFRTRDGYPWKVLAMGPGHGIALASGRLVVPVWLAKARSHRPSVSATIYSDDRGVTWRAGEIIVATSEETPNPSEHQVVELADGRVMANIRTESPRHRRVVSYSSDGASEWTKPEFVEALYEPICMGSTVRLSGTAGDRAVLFCNPSSKPAEAADGKGNPRERRNLTVRMSEDGGRTWPRSRVIEPGPSGYSDMAVAADGTVLVLYEAGPSVEKKRFVPGRIKAARFRVVENGTGVE